MNLNPLVSVIIPCYNAGSFLAEALESIFCQTMKDFEILVIDDGSTDNTPSLIRSYGSRIRAVFCSHRGPSAARNRGIELARGEFIQYLDADDLLVPTKFELQLEALKRSNADVAYSNWQRLLKIEGRKYVKSEVVTLKEIKNPEIDLLTDSWCAIHSYLFRRSIVEEVGGWNEGLSIIQDARFALDCALRGGRFVYCPGVMCYYRIHGRDSVSTRGSVGFTRDCFKNACEIKEWWGEHGGIDKDRKKALLKVYGQVARASFEKDRATFEAAYQTLEQLSPGYIPREPKHLRLVSRLVGYRRAEGLALWYRRILK